jgi:hypothetical protein
MGSIILLWAIGGVLFMPIIIQFTCTTHLGVSHKTFGLHNICFGIWKVLHTLNKIRRQAIPVSFCNNIVNHEIIFFKKIFIPCSLYDVKHIDSRK